MYGFKYNFRFLSLAALIFAITAMNGSKAQTVAGTGRIVKVSNIPKVHLRWLPTGDTLAANAAQPEYHLNAWSRFKQEGYVIKRRRMNGTTVLPAVELTVTVLPDSLALLQTSNATGPDAQAAGILFGALYDQVVNTPGQIGGKDIQMVSGDGSDEREQRYALTALGAELSFPAAQKAGLGWIDNLAIIGYTYEYEITEAGAASSGQTGRSVKVVVKNLYTAPTAPPAPKLRLGDKKAALSWRWFLPGLAAGNLSFQNAYSSYLVEKATIYPVFFSRVSAMPIMSLTESSDSLFFVVPLSVNNEQTYFRIVGRTAFGEEVASGIVSGKGVDPPATWLPRIDSTAKLTGGSALLHWVFPSDTVVSQVNALLNGFEVHRSTNLDNFQKQTVGGVSLFPASTRQVTLPPAQSEGYFMVTAKYKTGQSTSSIPVLIQRVDSLPPAVPMGLQAVWEPQAGSLRLNWIGNIESDLLGYKVFRANLAGEEPVLLADVRGAATYLDTALRVDNPKAWYYVLAYDQRFNQSGLSPVLVADKPDLIAPASPYFRGGQSGPQGIDLAWHNSVSSDVATYNLTRKPAGTQQPATLLRTWNASSPDSVYTDSAIPASGRYTYVIQAADSTGNQSRDSILVDVASLNEARPPVAGFAALSDSTQGVRLTWACQGKDVVEIEVTRLIDDYAQTLAPIQAPSAAPSSGGGGPPVWKSLDGLACGAWDRESHQGPHQRTYGIRALYSDGSKSPETSVTVEVN